ncbi:YadA C-terminal domain-containing protein [Acinetobacter sp. NS-4]|uniref:YadA C-terminal domain-containing protein n=1 Tax=Acinetobacter sp. NS-4 TaxID=3127956 RepID=UPI00307E8D8A
MNLQNTFKLSAVALAVSLSAAAYADTTVTDIDSVNIVVDNNDGSVGSFNVIKGVTNPTTLITSDVNTSGGTVINTNTAINGNFNVNGGTSTILTAAPVTTGADLVIPTVNAAFANTTQPFSQNRDDTQDQTRSVDSQIIDQNKFQLNTSVQTGQQSWTTSQTASAQYDANGVIIPGSLTGPVLGATVDNGFTASSVNQIQDLVLGRNNATEDYQLSISKTDNGVTNSTTVNASGISTGQITLAGQDLATTLATEAATRAAADTALNTRVDTEAATRAAADTQLQANIDTEAATRLAADTQLQANIDTEAATRAAADTALNTRVDTEAATRAAVDTQLQANIDTEAAARTAADTALNTRVDTETAARTAADTALNTRVDTETATRAAADVVLQDNINAEAATRTAADTALNTRVDTEAATRAAGLAAAATDRQAIRSEFANGDVATLASANAYTNTQVANVNSRVNQLNSRVDDVEKTSYRGIAIALAAQQQIPNIGAGQFAVFGGVGHYEGESAGALGIASVFADGRTSVSAAVGFAGGNEVGGRVGVSYVFGGK